MDLAHKLDAVSNCTDLWSAGVDYAVQSCLHFRRIYNQVALTFPANPVFLRSMNQDSYRNSLKLLLGSAQECCFDAIDSLSAIMWDFVQCIDILLDFLQSCTFSETNLQYLSLLYSDVMHFKDILMSEFELVQIYQRFSVLQTFSTITGSRFTAPVSSIIPRLWSEQYMWKFRMLNEYGLT